MRSLCSICADLFDGYLPIVAAPCGHVYHSSCLKSWLGTSKTCPECRVTVTLKSITKLFFNLQSHNYSLNNSVLENRVDELKSKLSEKDILLQQLRREKEEIRVYTRVSEERAEQLQQRNYEFESEINQLRCRVKSLSKVEAKSCKLEQENMRLKQQLEHLGHVQVIISGSQKDVEDMVKDYCVGEDSLKQLATYCILLKREINKVIESKSSLRQELVSLNKQNGLSTLELNRANKIIKSLREQNSALEEKLRDVQTPFKQKDNVNLQNDGIIYGSSSSTDKATPGCSKSVTNDVLTITPILMPSSGKKRKLDIVVLDKEKKYSLKGQSISNMGQLVKKFSSSGSTIHVENRNSIIQVGYNGFGGHSQTVVRNLPIHRKVQKK